MRFDAVAFARTVGVILAAAFASAVLVHPAGARVTAARPVHHLQRETPIPADALADSVGVNAHFDGFGVGSPYDTHWTDVRRYLIESGIRHLRADPFNSPFSARVASLYSYGIRNSLGANHHMVSDLPDFNRHVAVSPHAEMVECDNELDGSDANWVADDRACQQWLYATVKSNRAYSHLAVLTPSTLSMAHVVDLGDLSHSSDYGSMHYGPAPLNPGNRGFGDCFPWAAPQSGASCSVFGTIAFGRDAVQRNNVGWNKAVMATEVAYADKSSPGNYVPDAQQALYWPRYFLLAYQEHIVRSYIYQFCNMSKQDATFGYEGLLDDDAAPKPQYYAIKSFVRFLADPGPSFETTPLALHVAGDKNTRHVLMQKRNGEHILAVWEERADWDTAANAPLHQPAVPVSVELRGSHRVTAYTYTPSWSLQAASVPKTKAGYRIEARSAVTFLAITGSGR